MAMRARCPYSEVAGDDGDAAFGESPLSAGQIVRSAGDSPERLWSRAVPNLYLLYEGSPGPKSGRNVG